MNDHGAEIVERCHPSRERGRLVKLGQNKKCRRGFLQSIRNDKIWVLQVNTENERKE